MAARADEMEGVQLIIPEGGSDALGAWGYVRCLEELANELGSRPATIVFPVGSGGTAAGLLAGSRLLGLPYRLIGVCVAPDRELFQQRIAEIVAAMERRHGVDVSVDPEGIELWDYSGLGYGLSRPEELAHGIELARLEGLFVDPVYTGKALHGLMTEVANGRKLSAPVVFLHTGGIFSLFADSRIAEQL
jgi:D-cysteine desulfhydrase